MFICEFICAIIGVTSSTDAAVKAQIALICIYIFFFASTWGPGAWVVIGEIFPIPIRSRGVGLSTASNWLWNCMYVTLPTLVSRRIQADGNSITVITPYLVGTDQAVSHPRISFQGKSTVADLDRTSDPRSFSFGVPSVCSAWSTPTSSFGRPRVRLLLFCPPCCLPVLTSPSGLTLEQVDRMMEETGSPRNSPGWTPHSTYAAEMGITETGKLPIETVEAQQAGEKAHIVAGTSHLNHSNAV